MLSPAEGILTTYPNGSTPLNEMAIIPVYGKKKTKKKNTKNFLFQKRESFEAESFYIASSTQGLPNLFRC